MNTVVGPISIRADGAANIEFNAYQWLGGKPVMIWPEKHAGAKFAYPAPAWDKR